METKPANTELATTGKQKVHYMNRPHYVWRFSKASPNRVWLLTEGGAPVLADIRIVEWGNGNGTH